ncbi:MAG: ion channel [Crocosphaera sp.]
MIRYSGKLYSLTIGYNTLFLNLLILFFLVPFASFHRYLSLLVSFFFLTTLLLGLNALILPSKALFSLRFIAALGFVADVIVFPNSPYLTGLTSLLAYSCNSLFILFVIIAIGLRIYQEKQVSLSVIRGGICVYLLLGIFWYCLYKIILFFDPNAFSVPEGLTKHSLFYFSFTTLTALGYGDILPNNSFAMILANLEAVLGQMYPAIVIAKLVSLYKVE